MDRRRPFLTQEGLATDPAFVANAALRDLSWQFVGSPGALFRESLSGLESPVRNKPSASLPAGGSVSKSVSTNRVDSGRLGWTRGDSRFDRKPRDSRTLATKDEWHRLFTKCHALGFVARHLKKATAAEADPRLPRQHRAHEAVGAAGPSRTRRRRPAAVSVPRSPFQGTSPPPATSPHGSR